MISGLIILLPLFVLELYSGRKMVVSTAAIGTIVYVGLFASVLAFIFWNKAVRTIGANKAGPFIQLIVRVIKPCNILTMVVLLHLKARYTPRPSCAKRPQP